MSMVARKSTPAWNVPQSIRVEKIASPCRLKLPSNPIVPVTLNRPAPISPSTLAPARMPPPPRIEFPASRYRSAADSPPKLLWAADALKYQFGDADEWGVQLTYPCRSNVP